MARRGTPGEADEILFHGWLLKMKSKKPRGAARFSSRWNKRYFTVEAVKSTPSSNVNFAVSYFYTKAEALDKGNSNRQAAGWFYLSTILDIHVSERWRQTLTTMESSKKWQHGFIIRTNKREWHLRAQNPTDYAMWLCGIAATCGICPPESYSWPHHALGDIPPLCLPHPGEQKQTQGSHRRSSGKSPSRARNSSASSGRRPHQSPLSKSLRNWQIESDDEEEKQVSVVNKHEAISDAVSTASRRRSGPQLHHGGTQNATVRSRDSRQTGRPDQRENYEPERERNLKHRRGNDQRDSYPEQPRSTSRRENLRNSDRKRKGARGEGERYDGNDIEILSADVDKEFHNHDNLSADRGEGKRQSASDTGTRISSGMEKMSATEDGFYHDNWRTREKLKRMKDRESGGYRASVQRAETLSDIDSDASTSSCEGPRGGESRSNAGSLAGRGRQSLPIVQDILHSDGSGASGGSDTSSDSDSDTDAGIGQGRDFGEEQSASPREGRASSMQQDSIEAAIAQRMEMDKFREDYREGRVSIPENRTKQSTSGSSKYNEPMTWKKLKDAGSVDTHGGKVHAGGGKKKGRRKSKAKRHPHPPKVPHPPVQMTGAGANLVQMDSNFLEQNFDTDSEDEKTTDAAQKNGERKESTPPAEPVRPKTNQAVPSYSNSTNLVGRAANVITEDSNWLEDNFDDDDDDKDEVEDEGKRAHREVSRGSGGAGAKTSSGSAGTKRQEPGHQEGKSSDSVRKPATSPRSRSVLAGVSVDKNFLESDWDESSLDASMMSQSSFV